METIKFTVYLETKPEDAKGLNIVSCMKTKTPWKVDGSRDVDMDAIDRNRSKETRRELADRSDIIDLQREYRQDVLTKLGLTKTRESATQVEERILGEQMRNLDAQFKSGAIDKGQYTTMKGIIERSK